MRLILWILAIIGGFFLLMILGLTGAGLWGFNKAVALAAEASAYADETIAAYGETWDENVLKERAAPELLTELAANPAALTELSEYVQANAGAFISAEPSICENINYSASASAGEIFTAECVTRGAVEKGVAVYTISVIKRSDFWRVLGFAIEVVSDTEEPETGTLVNYVAADPASAGALPAVSANLGARAVTLTPFEGRVSMRMGAHRDAFIGVAAQQTQK